MENFDLVVLVAGGLLLLLDLLSEVVRRLWLSVPLVALGLGVLLGPDVLAVIDPEELGDPKLVLEGLARLALALAVVDIALRFNRGTLQGVWRAGLRLLFGGMLGMWLLTGLGAWLLLDVPFWVGMLIGAILTPTDPVVAATLTSEAMARANLPLRLRRLLQLESGANDGLAIVLFLLPVIVLTQEGGELSTWLGKAAVEVAVAVGGGVLLGAGAAATTNLAVRNKDIQRPLLFGVTVGISLVALGGAHLLEGSGIIAAFVGALVFALVLGDDVRRSLESVHQSIANLLVPPVFGFFGMVLPFGDWAELGLPALAFAGWVLLVRRPPVVPVVLAGTGVARRDRAFLAWFGPIGVAAMYYATAIEAHPELPQTETIFAAATLAICASVVAHGITATPLVRRYAGRSALHPLLHPLTAEQEEARDLEREQGEP